MALSTVICKCFLKKAWTRHCTLYFDLYLIFFHVEKGMCPQSSEEMDRGLLIWWRWGKCVTHMQCSTFCAVRLCSSFSFWQSWLKHVSLVTKLFVFFWERAIPGQRTEMASAAEWGKVHIFLPFNLCDNKPQHQIKPWPPHLLCY